MTLAEVKEYLRVDGTEEDALIGVMMAAAADFIVGAVGKFDESMPKAKMLYLAAVQDMFDNRQLVAVSSTGYSASQYYRNMVESLIRQLQTEMLIKQEEEAGDV